MSMAAADYVSVSSQADTEKPTSQAKLASSPPTQRANMKNWPVNHAHAMGIPWARTTKNADQRP